MADLVGQRLGNYRLQRLLGKGGFAEVYLGQHLRLNTLAAIKVLHTKLASEEEIEAFQQEAQTIAQLVHPHIVRILDFDVADDMPFLVMDYAPNGTLRQRYPKGSVLSPAAVLPYVKQVAEALQYAHDKKLIHRDIKPENLLLGDHQQVLLSDFGIALVAQSSRYQNTQEVVGTFAYMAPEQLQGHPSRPSDQYSLGIVLYEWLTGSRPFQGSFTELYSQQMFVSPAPLHVKMPTISLGVEHVVLTMLEKDPKARFGNLHACATAFEQACQEESLLSAPTQFARPTTPLIQPAAIKAPPPVKPVPTNMTPPAALPPTIVTPPPVKPQPTRVTPSQPSASTVTPSSLPPAFSAARREPPVPAPLKRSEQPKRKRSRSFIVGGTLVVLLVIAVSIGLAVANSPQQANSQQQVATGPHITSIQTGTAQGESSSTVTVGTEVFVTFHIKSDVSTYVTVHLFDGYTYVYEHSESLAAGDYSDHYTVRADGVYTWKVAYDHTPEASITFQVTG